MGGEAVISVHILKLDRKQVSVWGPELDRIRVEEHIRLFRGHCCVFNQIKKPSLVHSAPSVGNLTTRFVAQSGVSTVCPVQTPEAHLNVG